MDRINNENVRNLGEIDKELFLQFCEGAYDAFCKEAKLNIPGKVTKIADMTYSPT